MTDRYNAEGDSRQTDEFMKPIILNSDGLLKDNDTLVFIDFRADRMREIVEAIGIKPQFDTDCIPSNLVCTHVFHIACVHSNVIFY